MASVSVHTTAPRWADCDCYFRTFVLEWHSESVFECGAAAEGRSMTMAELRARALTRAYDQRVHIFSVPGRPGVYVTRSKSEPHERYNLVVEEDAVACSCRGFQYRE